MVRWHARAVLCNRISYVFPQCSVGIQVGHEYVYTGNGNQVSARSLYRTIDRVGDKSHWTEIEERPERDLALERRILAFRSHRYPQTKIFHAECLRSADEARHHERV